MLEFSKYQALGNDYIVFDEGDLGPHLTPTTVRRICDRNFGVGSDGILLFETQEKEGDLSLRIFNPDGSEAEKSGNGIRIFSRYLWDKKIVGKDRFDLRTRGGTVSCLVLEGAKEITVDMGRPNFKSKDIPVKGPEREVLDEEFEIAGIPLRYSAVSMGNPHCVIMKKTVTATEAKTLGPLVEVEDRFVNKTNVQFLEILDRSNIKIEIWERGAGYTLASGSSSCAAAAVANRLGLCDRGITVHMPGGAISIEIQPDGMIRMTGPVVKVCDGSLSIEVLRDGDS